MWHRLYEVQCHSHRMRNRYTGACYFVENLTLPKNVRKSDDNYHAANHCAPLVGSQAPLQACATVAVGAAECLRKLGSISASSLSIRGKAAACQPARLWSHVAGGGVCEQRRRGVSPAACTSSGGGSRYTDSEGRDATGFSSRPAVRQVRRLGPTLSGAATPASMPVSVRLIWPSFTAAGRNQSSTSLSR